VLTLVETATRVGSYAWFERALFEVIGGWVPTMHDPTDLEPKVFFADVASRHAWHAELWAQRLPTLREIDAAALTTAAPAGGRDLIAALGEPGRGVDRLAALSGSVWPRYVATLDAHAGIAAPLADASVLRTLHLVRTDLANDIQAANRLLSTLLPAAELEAVTSAAVDRLRRQETPEPHGGS